jgi:UDP-N-acetylmuramoylalanine--D-glutamate ligase
LTTVMFDLTNKIVVIIGAQRSGFAAAKLAYAKGAHIKLSECADEISPEIIEWMDAHKCVVEQGGHTQEFLDGADCVILSPGIPAYAEVIVWAKAKNILVLGEIEFAYQFCNGRVIAVTGSNGKTTTVNLIHNLLNEAGINNALCGNVGAPFSDFVSEEKYEYFVVEVSSFQLESMIEQKTQEQYGVKGFEPYIAALLNFTQNHLDRHKDMNEYLEAKVKIFSNQTVDDFAVLNAHDFVRSDFVNQIDSDIVYFNEEESVSENQNVSVLRAVAEVLGIDDVCPKVIEDFCGVEHRFEFLGTVNGVDYINDSKSTTLESGKWALSSVEKPTILLCGGRDKNLDFTTISDYVNSRVKKVIVYGEARLKIAEAFKSCEDLKQSPSMNEAFELATQEAKNGDCILLSPMCASFDEFKNFEKRGSAFKELVKKLKS